jgi:hypothetical protein
MSKFSCPRCGYNTQYRYNMRKHLSRTHICQATLQNLSKEECFALILNESPDGGITKVSQTDKKSIKKVSQPEEPKKKKEPEIYIPEIIPQQQSTILEKIVMPNIMPDPPVNETNNIYICNNCQKSFSKKNNLYRHKKHYCKNLNTLSNDELIERNTTQSKLIEELKNENELLKNSKSTNIQNNNITNNIIINAFGQENLDYIKKEYIHALIKAGPYGSIQKLIKQIHFNPNHKENHNIKIPNKRDKYGMIFDGNKWQFKNKKSMITTIADHAYGIIAEHCEDLNNRKLDKFREEYENENSELMKRIADDTELVILNGQKEMGLF